MIKSIRTRLAAWRRHRETIRELSTLSDHELADLGIGRGDILFVADGSLRANHPAPPRPRTTTCPPLCVGGHDPNARAPLIAAAAG